MSSGRGLVAEDGASVDDLRKPMSRVGELKAAAEGGPSN